MPAPPRLRAKRVRLRLTIVALILHLFHVLPSPTNLSPRNVAYAESFGVPNFWNLEHKPEPILLPPGETLRFGLDPSYPPFAFEDGQGRLRGFNVELVRELCLALGASCTVKVLPWAQLVPDLASDQVDVVAAGHRPSRALYDSVDSTQPYFRLPARFVARKGAIASNAVPTESLANLRIGVVERTAHAAFLEQFFQALAPTLFPNRIEMREALVEGEIDVLFDDAASYAQWLTESGPGSCCQFIGGPYLASHFFGEGMVMLVRKGRLELRNALEFGLFQLYESGEFSELYLRYFPVEIF